MLEIVGRRGLSQTPRAETLCLGAAGRGVASLDDGRNWVFARCIHKSSTDRNENELINFITLAWVRDLLTREVNRIASTV